MILKLCWHNQTNIWVLSSLSHLLLPWWREVEEIWTWKLKYLSLNSISRIHPNIDEIFLTFDRSIFFYHWLTDTNASIVNSRIHRSPLVLLINLVRELYIRRVKKIKNYKINWLVFMLSELCSEYIMG